MNGSALVSHHATLLLIKYTVKIPFHSIPFLQSASATEHVHYHALTVYIPYCCLVIMWRRTYLALVVLRLYLALSPSYLHPDEHFQGPEVIAGKLS